MKLTKLEKKWILYDMGNSAFVLLSATIVPIFFKNLTALSGMSNADSTAIFSYATSVVTAIVAILGPILGGFADRNTKKKQVFTGFVLLGAAGCTLLWIPENYGAFLTLFVAAKVGLNGSLVFYDSMLSDVTTGERMDDVSSQGYAWGYLGSCIPFIISLGLILGADVIGIAARTSYIIVFTGNGLWWFFTTLPLLLSYKQKELTEKRDTRGLGKVLAEIKNNKKVLYFLIAFFFYIDGVYTIIDMATSYGKDMGISDTNLVLALLLTQIVAFPCSIAFGKLCTKISNVKLISACILGYIGITLFALQLDKPWEFWFLAVLVAVFQGGIQALSRSYYAKIIPQGHAAEYFGFFDIFGKGAAFLGTILMGVSTQLFQTSKAGVGSMIIMFMIGFVFFRIATKKE